MEPFFYRVKPRHLSPDQLDQVLSRGWYRMRQDLFTISHLAEEFGFYRVHWLRVDVNRIIGHRSHRRIRKNHAHCSVVIEPLITVSEEHRNLHRKYRRSIDFDGVRSIQEGLFGEEVTDSIFSTWSISVYDGEKLIAAGYFDIGAESAASILHFFDPEYAQFSPGKFLILCTIDFMRSKGLQWYYPGYVVAGKPKMDYKLFLGREVVEYFSPEVQQWRPFVDQILLDEPIIIPVLTDTDDENSQASELQED